MVRIAMDEVAIFQYGSHRPIPPESIYGSTNMFEIHESQNVPVEQPSNIQAQEASILQRNGSVSQTPILSIQDENHSEATTSLVSSITEKGGLEERTEHSVEDAETRERREHAFDDLEQLMHEMAHMRENLRLIPDPLRKEMAGRLAMKMASIFSDDEENEDLD